MRGDTEVEGQDIDLPFVVRPATIEGQRITELLRRFESYAAASYPSTPRTVTGSSVELNFAGTELAYDLVPMLVSPYPDYQVILKKDGSRRLTSVAKHTEFVRRRTALSDQLPGRVKFNECVRIMKWWRCIRIGESNTIDEVRTTLIELLCASAYDRLAVESTYTETLLKWFSWLTSVTANRQRVSFSEYSSIEVLRESDQGNALWRVIDPVNANNNVVHSTWGNIELSEFASWFAEGRDAMSRVVAHEKAGNDGIVDDILAALFGNSIIDHGAVS